MGFRFRKSVKIAPGIKLNFGKKGTSVTVGNKYARTTIGKGRKTNSVSLPGTGISYVQTSTNKKASKVSNQSSNNSVSGGNGNNGPNQQMSWETARRIIKWSFYAFLAFFIFMMSTDSKAVFIGAAVIVVGMILTRLKRKNIIKFKQTWLVSALGWILAFSFWDTNVEPVENNVQTAQQSSEINSVVSTPVEPEKEVVENTENQLVTTPVESESNTLVETLVVEEPIKEVVAEEMVEEPISEPVIENEYYQNCTELRKVYPSGVAQDHPAYTSKHDRDKDGWACER